MASFPNGIGESVTQKGNDAGQPNNKKDEVNYVRLPTDPATKASGVLQNGEEVTGGISGATGDIVRIGPDTSYVDVTNVAAGPFNAAETLTGGTSGATVDTNGAPTTVDPNAFRTGKRGSMIMGGAAA